MGIVGARLLPLGVEVPRRLWRSLNIGPNGKVLSWVIEDGKREYVTTRLTEEEVELPLAGIWNHEFLTLRIAAGWDPTQER